MFPKNYNFYYIVDKKWTYLFPDCDSICRLYFLVILHYEQNVLNCTSTRACNTT